MSKTYQILYDGLLHSVEADAAIYAIDKLANKVLRESCMMLQGEAEMSCKGRTYCVVFEDGMVGSIYCSG